MTVGMSDARAHRNGGGGGGEAVTLMKSMSMSVSSKDDVKKKEKNNRKEEGADDDELEVKVVWSSESDGSTLKRKDGGGDHDTNENNENGDVYGAPSLSQIPRAMEMNAEGNKRLKSGNLEDAVAAYTRALREVDENANRSGGGGKGGKTAMSDPRAGIPLSNRSHAYLRLAMQGDDAGDAEDRDWYLRQSIKDADVLCRLCPHWSKARHRLASALLCRGEYAKAAKAVREGIAKSKNDFCARRDFSNLYDEVTMTAAARGSLAGFSGRLLEVRSAGDDAWLGLPAPKDPVLDADEDAQAEPMMIAGEGENATATTLAALGASDANAWKAKREKTSFRSIKDAVANARDNDRIVLLRGVHNIGGEAVHVNKRLLIYGEGRLGETVIDQRANAPTFTVSRPCVIRNIKIELTGFRECLRFQRSPSAPSSMPVPAVSGGISSPSAVVEGCVVSSSGSDGVHIVKSDPLIRNCTITGRHCAVIASAAAPPAPPAGAARSRQTAKRAIMPRTGTLLYCRVGTSGDSGDGDGGGGGGGGEQQCVRAMHAAHIAIACCELSGAKMEGVVCMDSARVSIVDSSISGCGGPGIDVTGDGVVTLTNSSVTDNCGGIWVWERGHVQVLDGGRSLETTPSKSSRGYGILGQSVVKGGSSHSLLVCDSGRVDCGHNAMVEGVVDVYDDAAVDFGIANGVVSGAAVELGVRFEPTSLPPEKGPAFRFVPNEFTRKQ